MRKNALFASIVLLFVCSCEPVKDKEQNGKAEYFDLKGYFDKEIIKLSRLRPLIQKTVSVNGNSETKAMTIKDWKSELSVFGDADINRASWKGLFSITKTDSSLVYSSDNEKVFVRKIEVNLRNNQPYKILIVVQNKNILYKSQDNLTYCVDSVYSIQKQQNIRFLSNKNYLIKGKFK